MSTVSTFFEGEWRPYDLDDSTVVVIESCNQSLHVNCYDADDREVYSVSKMRLTESSLGFEILVQSTSCRAIHSWRLASEYVVLDDCTYKESWCRRGGDLSGECDFGNLLRSEYKSNGTSRAEWLLGRWEPDEGYAWGPVVKIEGENGRFKVQEYGEPETRNEIYVVSNVSWENGVLIFKTGIPSNWSKTQRFKIVSKNKVDNEVTIHSQPWKKVLVV